MASHYPPAWMTRRQKVGEDLEAQVIYQQYYQKELRVDIHKHASQKLKVHGQCNVRGYVHDVRARKKRDCIWWGQAQADGRQRCMVSLPTNTDSEHAWKKRSCIVWGQALVRSDWGVGSIAWRPSVHERNIIEFGGNKLLYMASRR